jgi:hypothetical protein
MNPPPSKCSTNRNWKVLYRAAILERNKGLVAQRVSIAEDAVIARARELFYQAGTSEERDDLEDALYALHAFRTAWEHLDAA